VETSDAGAIAKAIKKSIVNDEKLTITNKELENYIHKSLEQHDYGHLIPIYEYMDKFFKRRFPMIMFLSGTYSCIKTTLSIIMADRLNIANMISTDLIKVMMENLRAGIRLPSREDLLTSTVNIDEFMALNQNCWKGAVMDVSKVFKEGKPLVFEGVLNFKDIIDSPYQPTAERWELAKKFIEGDSSINMITLFDQLNPNPNKEAAAKFTNISWLKKDATGSELNIIAEFEAAKDIPAVIVPIIVIINKNDHFHIIKEKLLKECVWYHKYFQSISCLNILIGNIHSIFQNLQERLIRESPGILVPVSLSTFDRDCVNMQSIVLKQIEYQFCSYLESLEKEKKAEQMTKAK